MLKNAYLDDVVDAVENNRKWQNYWRGYRYENKISSDANGNYTIQYALAGFKRENIKISVSNNVIYIKATGDNKFRSNLDHSYDLGPLIDQDNIKSTFVDGMLTVTLPAKKTEVKAIEIKVE